METCWSCTRERWTALATWLERPLSVVDVGCRWGFADRWLQLGERVRLVGFEPDREECGRLAETYREAPTVTVVPLALGDARGRRRLHLTRQAGCSSFYRPDESVRTGRPTTRDELEPVGETDVEVTTLDHWIGERQPERIDFLKIDTQGAELDVLRGAEQTLQDVRVLEVEVEFNPLYEDMPLFADIDIWLRQHGFVLWRLRNQSHYGLAEAGSDVPLGETHHFDSRPVSFEAQGGQLYWADAYYVRRELAFDPAPSWRDAVRDAVISDVVGFPDLALACVERVRTDLPEAVQRALSEPVSPPAI